MSRLKIYLTLGLALVLSGALLASAPFLPKKSKTRKPNISDGARSYSTRTYGYTATDPGKPSEGEVMQAIQESKPGSPNEVAQQAMGLSQPCPQTALAALQAIKAQLDAILAKVQQDYYNQLACGLNVSCALYWANQAIADASSAAALGAQAESLAAQAMAEAACASSSSVQATPPGITLDRLMGRLGATYKDGSRPGLGYGSGSASMNLANFGGAFQQLMNADADLRQALGSSNFEAMHAWAGKAYDANAAKARLDAAQAASEGISKKEAKADPAQAAAKEYWGINYKELGPKYAALAEQSHAQADQVAQQALSHDWPVDENSRVKDEPGLWDKGVAVAGKVLNDAKDQAIDEAKDSLKDKFKEGVQSALESVIGEKSAEAMIGVVEIEQGVIERTQDILNDLKGAMGELGSASTSSPKTEALLAKIDEHLQTTWKDASDKSKDVLGFKDQDDD